MNFLLVFTFENLNPGAEDQRQDYIGWVEISMKYLRCACGITVLFMKMEQLPEIGIVEKVLF